MPDEDYGFVSIPPGTVPGFVLARSSTASFTTAIPWHRHRYYIMPLKFIRPCIPTSITADVQRIPASASARAHQALGPSIAAPAEEPHPER